MYSQSTNQLKFEEKLADYHNVNFEAKLTFKKKIIIINAVLSKHDKVQVSCFELKKLIKMINMLNFIKFH